jgi:hypothetical protein
MVVLETMAKAVVCFERLVAYAKISVKLPPLDLPED